MSVAASIKVVDLFPDRSDGHDVTDWLKHDAVGAKLFEAIKAAPEWQPGDDKPIAAATPEDEALLAELAALSPLDYAKRRKRAADEARHQRERPRSLRRRARAREEVRRDGDAL